MGIRMNQFIGLNPRAMALVAGEQILLYVQEVTRVYPDGRREELEPEPVCGSTVKQEESGEVYSGMFDEKFPLGKYIFPDGTELFEQVQADPWSSGPCIFLALKDENWDWVPESLWTEEEINAAC